LSTGCLHIRQVMQALPDLTSQLLIKRFLAHEFAKDMTHVQL